MGWNDLGLHSNNLIHTPVLDSFMKEGIPLQRYYSQDVCSPTRAVCLLCLRIREISSLLCSTSPFWQVDIHLTMDFNTTFSCLRNARVSLWTKPLSPPSWNSSVMPPMPSESGTKDSINGRTHQHSEGSIPSMDSTTADRTTTPTSLEEGTPLSGRRYSLDTISEETTDPSAERTAPSSTTMHQVLPLPLLHS